MRYLIGLILGLCLTAAYAQTLTPSGGGGGVGSFSTLNLTSGGSQSAPALSIGNATTGVFAQGTTALAFTVNGTNQMDFGITSSAEWNLARSITVNGNIFFNTQAGVFGWSFPAGSVDTGLSRDSVGGIIDVGNGTAADVSGTLKGRGTISASTSPATTGSCVIGSLVGGSTAGTFTATNACGAPATAVTAVVLLLPVNATNGWSCDAQDRTAKSATALVQVASTVSAVNFQAITATNDVIQWKCIGY